MLTNVQLHFHSTGAEHAKPEKTIKEINGSVHLQIDMESDTNSKIDSTPEEVVYVLAAKLANRLSISRQTVYNLVGSVFKERVHYFRGLNGRPLCKWQAVVELVESSCPSDYTKGNSSLISAIRVSGAASIARFPTLPKIRNDSDV